MHRTPMILVCCKRAKTVSDYLTVYFFVFPPTRRLFTLKSNGLMITQNEDCNTQNTQLPVVFLLTIEQIEIMISSRVP